MKRIDRAMAVMRKIALQMRCPGQFLDNYPRWDASNPVERGGIRCGCRGITCDECWNIDDDSPEPPEKAHWITHGDYERYECSRCGEDSAYSRARNPWRTTYCPHCGASMKG